MEDAKIIDLYWKRDENAIAETDYKYGCFCHTIAIRLLGVREDAEECVNDTYQQAWNAIPPQRPSLFKAWLGKIVRNISINLWNKNHAKKRYHGIDQILVELDDCVPAPQSVSTELERAELAEVISTWLLSLSQNDRILFVRRYWYAVPLKDLAKEQRMPLGKLTQKMYRLRLDLKNTLEMEGICL